MEDTQGITSMEIFKVETNTYELLAQLKEAQVGIGKGKALVELNKGGTIPLYEHE